MVNEIRVDLLLVFLWQFQEFVHLNLSFNVLLNEPLLEDLILAGTLVLDFMVDNHFFSERLQLEEGILGSLGANELL